ncbi:MAG: DNA polymerase I [Oligoflexia bacterium]|nr:DNA polymerase I [Oligoflexia bacterium]
MSKPLFADPEHTLYLLDISSFIFRAFFAIRSLSTRSGEPVNAVYGVATMLARIAEEARPQYLAVAYDSPEPSFREELYAEYKANRSEPPEDLIPQFARIEELVRRFEIHSYRMPGLEADDLIATLARKWCAESPVNRAVIVTGDKDLMQLVDERTRVWDTMAQKIYGPDEVFEKMGVRPDQIRDYLGLVGDSSDNIPGVAGVGPKTAAELLKEYGDLDRILAAAAVGKIKGKRGETLAASEKVARLSAELATVRSDLDVQLRRDELVYRFHVNEKCRDFLLSMDFNSLVARWAKDAQEGVVNGVKASVPLATQAASPKTAELATTGQASFALEAPGFAGAAPPAADSAPPVTPASAPAPATVNLPALVGPDKIFRTVNTEDDFQALLAALEKAHEVGFDLETTSLNPRQAEIVGFALCHDPKFACYVPVGHRPSLAGPPVEQLSLSRVLEGLRPFLEDPRRKKIGQNLKYDWNVLAAHGVHADGIGADTMVAAYVLDPEGRHNLATLAASYLDYSVLTYEQVCGKGKDALSFDQVPIDLATRYSAEDAWIAMRLWLQLKERLAQERLMEVFARVDLPLVQVLADMESEGVSIDTEWLRQLSEEFSRELRAIESRIQAYTSGPINLNSPKQLAVLLFEQLKLPVQGKTKTGYSTDAQVLETLAPLHEVPRLLLEYREISKLKGTYVDPLPLMRDSKTGKIHASFHQTVAATGRLSSSEPNLQNIPIRTERGRKIRRAFVPSPGNVLVAADYSQIELRLLAHMSGDPELGRAFREDEDVHRQTAAEIFRIPGAEVDERQRGIAKAINFGLMYGKTAFGLAQELKISRKEAQETIDRYFQRYGAVKRFLDQQILDARENGYVTTLLGRKRALPDIASRNQAIRNNAERMAMNSPIQGTAADLMKLAMTELAHRLRGEGLRSKLIIQVHDEVVLDCPREEAEAVKALVTRVMESSGDGHLGMKLSVPLRVNAAVGANWMDL